MAEADLSPTTFTSMSASDPGYDISTEDSSENESENIYTEASIDNHTQKQKAMQKLKSAGVRRCQRQSQSRSELNQVVIP